MKVINSDTDFVDIGAALVDSGNEQLVPLVPLEVWEGALDAIYGMDRHHG
jgi:hypothetical protein